MSLLDDLREVGAEARAEVDDFVDQLRRDTDVVTNLPGQAVARAEAQAARARDAALAPVRELQRTARDVSNNLRGAVRAATEGVGDAAREASSTLKWVVVGIVVVAVLAIVAWLAWLYFQGKLALDIFRSGAATAATVAT